MSSSSSSGSRREEPVGEGMAGSARGGAAGLIGRLIVRLATRIHPVYRVCPLRRLRDKLERWIADGLGDRIGRRVDGDLELLAPQARLLRFDLVVQQVRLMIQLEALLPQVQHEHRDQNAAREAE